MQLLCFWTPLSGNWRHSSCPDSILFPGCTERMSEEHRAKLESLALASNVQTVARPIEWLHRHYLSALDSHTPSVLGSCSWEWSDVFPTDSSRSLISSRLAAQGYLPGEPTLVSFILSLRGTICQVLAIYRGHYPNPKSQLLNKRPSDRRRCRASTFASPISSGCLEVLFDNLGCSETARAQKATSASLASQAHTSCRNVAETLLTIQMVSSCRRNNW